MKKYQFVVFMQDSDFDQLEKEIKTFFYNINDIDCFSYCFQWYEEKEKAIEILSQWDYNENEVITEKEFYENIGTAADIYISNDKQYALITYGFLSAIGLYRIIYD